MKIFKTSNKSFDCVAAALKNGGVLIYPTDTAYALGADPCNKKAVARIYKIKGRSKSKALPVIAASFGMVRQFFKLGNRETELAKKYWPGALSIILQARSKRLGVLIQHSHILPPSHEATDGQDKNVRMLEIAVRVPANKIARELARQLGRPIISTSANLSGRRECYSARQVYRQFKNKKYQPDLILDAGRLPKRKPSTIVRIKDGKIEIVRQGPINL